MGPSHKHAVATKTWVRARFGELTDELAQTSRVDDPMVLADQLTLIMEGVYASVQALGVDGPARRARSFVRRSSRRSNDKATEDSVQTRPRKPAILTKPALWSGPPMA